MTGTGAAANGITVDLSTPVQVEEEEEELTPHGSVENLAAMDCRSGQPATISATAAEPSVEALAAKAASTVADGLRKLSGSFLARSGSSVGSPRGDAVEEFKVNIHRKYIY